MATRPSAPAMPSTPSAGESLPAPFATSRWRPSLFTLPCAGRRSANQGYGASRTRRERPQDSENAYENRTAQVRLTVAQRVGDREQNETRPSDPVAQTDRWERPPIETPSKQTHQNAQNKHSAQNQHDGPPPMSSADEAARPSQGEGAQHASAEHPSTAAVVAIEVAVSQLAPVGPRRRTSWPPTPPPRCQRTPSRVCKATRRRTPQEPSAPGRRRAEWRRRVARHSRPRCHAVAPSQPEHHCGHHRHEARTSTGRLPWRSW